MTDHEFNFNEVFEYPDWQPEYKEAILETDARMLQSKIHRADGSECKAPRIADTTAPTRPDPQNNSAVVESQVPQTPPDPHGSR